MTARHPGPVTEILEQEVGEFKNDGVKFQYAVGSMQGWR